MAVLFYISALPCKVYDGTALLELADNVMLMRIDAGTGMMLLYETSSSIAATWMSGIAAALAGRRGHHNLRKHVWIFNCFGIEHCLSA